jgi:DNA-directed RNA polymerase specialized sigma24 family protein
VRESGYGIYVDDATRGRFLQKLGNYYARVLVDARWVAFMFGGRNDDEDALMQRARDLIHEVTFRILQGRRTWAEDVDFPVFMKMQMRSVASGEWKRVRRLDSIDQATTIADGEELPKNELGTDPHPVETALSEQEAEERVLELMEAAEGDETLTNLIDAYLEDDACERPRHVASRLKIPEKAVYQAQRKLERRVTARRKKVTRE